MQMTISVLGYLPSTNICFIARLVLYDGQN